MIINTDLYQIVLDLYQIVSNYISFVLVLYQIVLVLTIEETKVEPLEES